MRSTFKILFYINRAKVKADGTTAIMCRISIDGKQAVLSTGIYCLPEDWNPKKGVIKIERENNRLIEFRNRVEHTYEQILKLYNTTDVSTPIFPLPQNRDVIWNDINQIDVVAGLKENLSYHKSRHSFGTLLLSAGISIESIAKMMGHANISTTQGYANVTDDKISSDMDRLMERRKTMQNNANNTKKS